MRSEEKRWAVGAQGEMLLAERLARLCPSVPMLHDRRMPGSKANIDHVAVAATGVWVIDTKRYKGKIEVVKPLLGEEKLKIDGRDRTRLAHGLGKQVAAVRALLAQDDCEVPVNGCLCFVAPEGLLAGVGLPVLRTLRIGGYPLFHPRRLAKQLRAPGPLTSDACARLQARLAEQLQARA